MPKPSSSASTRQPTIRDVSRGAGVSTATVSRVLSGLGGASEATRRRIMSVVKELGYQPNRMARDLRSARSKVVGVVIPDLQNPFFTGIVSGIEEVLHEAGYTLFLVNSDGDLERERSELQTLRSERVCGVLLIPSQAHAPQYLDLAQSPMPVVAIDRVPEGLEIDCVTSANEEGAFQAVTQLIAAGYREIGMINGPDGFGVAKERSAGFYRALAVEGLVAEPDWVATGDFRSDSGYRATLQALGGDHRPRALFVGNFMMALGALRAIRELGLRIPEEVALISFDEMPWAAAMNPPLSTVVQPTRELGRTAAEMLLERLARPQRPARRIVLGTELMLRGSCGTKRKERV